MQNAETIPHVYTVVKLLDGGLVHHLRPAYFHVLAVPRQTKFHISQSSVGVPQISIQSLTSHSVCHSTRATVAH